MVENRGKFKSAGADYFVWAIRATNIFTSLALPRRNENARFQDRVGVSVGRFYREATRFDQQNRGQSTRGLHGNPEWLGLRSSDPPDQVFLLEFRFRPDGEGVQ